MFMCILYYIILYYVYIYNNKFTAQTNILEFSIKNCVLVLFFMSIVFRAFSSFSYEIKAIVVIAILCVSKRLPSIRRNMNSIRHHEL